MPKTLPQIDITIPTLNVAGSVLFENLKLTLETGKLTCLLGPSGIGKTTLLRIIAGLIKIDKPVTSHSISYLPQKNSLLPWLNAFENTLIGYRLRNQKPSNLIIEKAHYLFQQMGIQNAEKKFPHALSGGMYQRVALIRTLLEDQPVILMDEPFTAVDAITRFDLQNLVAEYLKNKTILLVTHDPIEALRIGECIYILSGRPGTLKKFGDFNSQTPRELNHEDIITQQNQLYAALRQARSESCLF